MRLVNVTSTKRVELVIGFMPTFVGMNYPLMHTIGAALTKRLPDGEILPEDLDRLSAEAVDLICAHFHKVEGLRAWLEAAQKVEIKR